MLKKISYFLLNHKLLIIICIILGAIPFFWFKPGYIDIGGDSSRLYFYDPVHYLTNFVLNPFLTDSLGIRSGQTYQLPFVCLLIFLRFILHWPWLVNTFFNSFSLIISFLVVYTIAVDFIKEFSSTTKSKLNITWAGIIAALFYIFIPISSMGGWDLALIIQTQSFVYPLLFWLFTKYVSTKRLFFLFSALLISFVFAQNFSWVSLPNMVAFFSITFLYILVYYIFVKKIKISFKTVIFCFFLFLLLHAFQYLPLFINLLEKNSDVSNQLLQGNILADTLHYVEIVANYTERGYQFLGVTPFSSLNLFSAALIIFPILIVLMLVKNKSVRLLIPIGFFLFLYWLVTAKITKIGLSLYKKMFVIPGFVMFRDFYGRWLEVFLLFYALLIGYAVFSLLISLKLNKKIIVLSGLILILAINAWPFINGSTVSRILTQDTGVVVKSRMQPDLYLENTLKYFRNDNKTGRNLSFPIGDFDYQIFTGESNDGAYEGPSIIAYLTGKADLASNFMIRPFSLGFFQSIKNNDSLSISNIFPLLNIQTVFYNSNPYIYETFATFPYNDAKLYFPKTQKELGGIVGSLPITQLKTFGPYYHVYSVNQQYVLPALYVAKDIRHIESLKSSTGNFDQSAFTQATYVLQHFRDSEADPQLRKVFIERNISASTSGIPQITFSRINPSKYIVTVKNTDGPYMLVFSQSFNQNWKLFLSDETRAKQELQKKILSSYFNNDIQEKLNKNIFLDTRVFETVGKNPIAENRHYLANAYANSWYILPSDVPGVNEYTLVLEMTDEKWIYVGFITSGLGIITVIVLLVRDLLKTAKQK